MIFKAMNRLTREHRGSLVTDVQDAHRINLDAEEKQGGNVAVFPSRILSHESVESFELVARGTATNDGVNSLCCPDCEVPLDLHQPDLGNRCSCWEHAEAVPGGFSSWSSTSEWQRNAVARAAVSGIDSPDARGFAAFVSRAGEV